MLKMFLAGAFGYPLLELAWRRRTHPSMALAGGISAVMIHRIGKTHFHPLCKAIICGAGITGIEAVCGVVFNRRHQVWDYRKMPCNWQGQICLPFTLAWCALSMVVIKAEEIYRRYKR